MRPDGCRGDAAGCWGPDAAAAVAGGHWQAVHVPAGGGGVPDRLRCRLCGEVIGVYEPVIVGVEAGWRETSVAAEPHLDGDCYHGQCLVLAQVAEPA